jgi:hypothetical protein
MVTSGTLLERVSRTVIMPPASFRAPLPAACER